MVLEMILTKSREQSSVAVGLGDPHPLVSFTQYPYSDPFVLLKIIMVLGIICRPAKILHDMTLFIIMRNRLQAQFMHKH